MYRPLQFPKRSQLFIGTHNVSLLVVAVCISNKSLDVADALRVKGVCSPKTPRK